MHNAIQLHMDMGPKMCKHTPIEERKLSKYIEIYILKHLWMCLK